MDHHVRISFGLLRETLEPALDRFDELIGQFLAANG
jgi:hypothetical protein